MTKFSPTEIDEIWVRKQAALIEAPAPRFPQLGGDDQATAGVAHGGAGLFQAVDLEEVDDAQLDAVVESAEECPGECIYIEP